MNSRKEEERNEKIIRGLLKLPPNRKCINCNSLGPQYVCTNFWTFICITCSGLHREFTHRVKSVSMAKFTSQEVDALQRGGNQRAREIFLKDWDTQRQRLTDNSNLDKIREFIKHVYVEKRYAGGKSSDKPPRDMQSNKNCEEEHRRASSYHSFSQSPPYDHQYEDRRYGKQTGVLTRRPGSDRGYFEGNISSIVYSPGRLGERMYEDKFANEGSVARVSDYSVSSVGDPFSFDSQSPNFQKDNQLTISQPSCTSVEDGRRQTLIMSEVNGKNDIRGLTRSQERSYTIKGSQQEGASPSPFLLQSSSASAASHDLFCPSFAPMPETSSAPSVDLFANVTQQNSSTTQPSSVSFAENEGWATFDLPNHATSATGQKIEASAIMPPVNAPTEGNHEQLSNVKGSMQLSSVESSTAHGPFLARSYQWHETTHDIKASNDPKIPEPWNAFDDPVGNVPQSSFENQQKRSETLIPAYMPPMSGDHQYKSSFEDFSKDAFQKPVIEDAISHISLPFDSIVSGSSFPPSALPPTGGVSSHAHERKSTNPFDLLYDSDFEPSNTFLDMSSLQTALPNPPLPTAYLDGLAEPWFPQNSVTPYITNVPTGGLAYVAGQVPSSQLPNIPSQGPVASLGGNPFA